MPLAGLICRGCGGLPVPFDHFATTQCGLTTCDPRLASAAVNHERGRYSYGGKAVTVTQLLGCPRAGAIQAAEDWWLDPLAMNAALTGVAWDKFLNDGVEKVTLEGHINGVTVTGEPDYLDEEHLIIKDDKHGNDFGRAEIVKSGAAKEEHEAQLSLYAELTEQALRWRPLDGYINYHWTSGVPVTIPVKLWPLEQVLEFRPHGGKATVLDNLRESKKPWREQALNGETVVWKSGKTMCDTCSVKEQCWAHAKGATF